MTSSIRYVLASLLICVTSSLFSAESTTKEVAPAAPVSSKALETRDAFLAFAFEKAKSYTDKAEMAVSKAVDAVGEEAPAAMKEFLVWRAWMHGVKGCFPLMVLCLGLFLFIKQWPLWELGGYNDDLVKGTTLNIILSIVGLISSLISTLLFLVSGAGHIMSFIQVTVAPRVYIIEQVMGMFK